ncbi:MAG: hypothetical protein M3R41_10250 [Pseudomonadota bacterium]|nr:hypothetical protein [Pseudomonadota bacterium]
MEVAAAGMDGIMRAVGMLQAGDRADARADLLRLWQEWAGTDAPLQQCTIAHFLADTEDDPAAELAWDMRALNAATGFDDDQDRDAVDPALANFLPSLHLNVADACRRLGEPERARRHVASGLARAPALDEDGYGSMIRKGLERLRDRLATES